MKKSVLVEHGKTQAHKQAMVAQEENNGISAVVSKYQCYEIDN